MIKNKMFSLFYIKIFVILLFLSNVPFFLFADTNNNPNDNERYTYQSNYLSTKYTRKSNYPVYCGDNNTAGDDWTTYPSSNLSGTGLSDYPTCLKKRYCSDLDEHGNLYITTPGYYENGKQTLNCYRKSCLDLTTAELKAIYNNQRASNHYYKFCEPVKYINDNDHDNITMAVGGLGNREPVYCNEFTKDELQYLIPNIWGRTGRNNEENEEVYQCLLHQCPLSNDVSVLCKTNFWMFSDKSESGQRIRSDDYISEYERKILVNDNSDISERYSLCTQLNCQKKRYSRLLSCNNGELNTDCDEYIGFDRKFGDQYDNLKNSFISYNGTIQTCSEDNTCRQTIDCQLEANANNFFCATYNGSAGSSDAFLSYFYRPYPHPATTEILNVDKNWLSGTNDGKKLSSEIYDKIFDNPTTSSSKITVIKRLMRGGAPKPLPNTTGDITEIRDGEIPVDVHLGELSSNYIKNYFHYINGTIYNTNRLNICMNDETDFKQYGFRKINMGSELWDEGEYYRATINSFSNKKGNFKISNAPHLIPLCDTANNKNTIYSSYSDASALCVINDSPYSTECLTPRSDSYYIKGKPIFKYKTDKPELEEVRVTACLRKRNANGSCGERECNVSATCDEDGCSDFKQTCGVDECVELIWTDNSQCNLSNNSNNGTNHCIKEIPNSKVRFRLKKIGNKMYVFIDDHVNEYINGATKTIWDSCRSDTNSNSDMTKIKSNSNKVEIQYFDTYQLYQLREGDEIASIITYRGRITDKNLLDSNDLIDYNGDGKIDDKDVFGEELYAYFKCGDADKDKKCDEMSTQNEEDNNPKWITWDIVQYIGNNQPTTNNPNCQVGSLKNCRGYYDAEGKFHKEQQGIPIPSPSSPKFFYKYATLNNSSNMFLPLLRIISAISYDGNPVDIKNTEDDNNIRLNFFEPTVRIGFGKKQTNNIIIPFNEMSTSGEIENNRKIKIKYKLKKTVDGVQEPSGSICLSRIIKEKSETQTEDIEEVVKCLKRKNPTIDSIMIKTPQPSTWKDGPYINVSFIKKESVNKTDNFPITLNDDNSIDFLSKTLGSSKDLKPNTYGEAQEYPIYIEKSRCSSLQYECMAYRSDLIGKKIKLEGLGINNETQQRILKAEIADLNKNISNCEDNIQKYCDSLNNGTFLVSNIVFDNNINTNIVNNYSNMRLCRLYKTGKPEYNKYSDRCTKTIKDDLSIEKLIKEEDKEENILYSTIETALKNYNLIGPTNDICISSGFSEYFPNVVANPSVGNTLGKCVLTDESKAKEECRRRYYYSLCTNNNDSECKCINGLSDCDCSDGISCAKRNDCNADNSANLPEECFLPGFNYYKTVFKVGETSDTLDISCQCKLYTSGSDTNGKEIRKATPRELGLCANLGTIPFCPAVKYYDENKVYNDGGAGKKLDVIKNKYKSNIWRTNQTKLGKYKIKNLDPDGDYGPLIGNLKHAEFDLTRSFNNDAEDKYNTQKLYCYNKDNSHYYVHTETEKACKSGYQLVRGITGECNGFWKNKETIKPLAYCHDNGYFYLYKNTGCERYSCPTINEDDPNYATDNEKSQINSSEIDYLTANHKGLSHGFANWESYKKGTYGVEGNEVENGHGDDIEQRTAESCIQGYAPAGFGKILYKYFPVAFNDDNENENENENEINQNFNKNTFIKNMLLNNDDFVDKASMRKTLSYDAEKYLPIRYCNQIGQWMPVEDIYTRFKIEPYNINNPIFHNNLTSDGYVNVRLYGKRGVAIAENNTYGTNVDYSQKYCERLFCRSFSYNDILQSIYNEEKDINKEELEKLKKYTLHTSRGYDISYFDNNEVNKFTYWRHTGGATWNETPTPLEGESIEIKGNCSSLAGYFPEDAEFLSEIKEEIANSGNIFTTRYSSFAEQHSDLFSNFSGGERNPRIFDFVSNRQSITKPTRQCDKWGIWGEIKNKCKKACEPIDPFRTKFSIDSKGKIQIDALYKIPHLRKEEDYSHEKDGTKYGDEYTGGAQWGRTLAGQYAIGECDSTISKDIHVIDENGHKIQSSKNIVFVRSSSPETIVNGITTGGRPYRECLPDGTWGTIQNPCILYEACPEKIITNSNLNYNVKDEKTVSILNSSSLTIDKIKEAIESGKTVEIKSSCDPRYYTGEITGQCPLTNKDWTGDITSTCELKTCSGFTKALGKNGSIQFLNVSDDQYFAKGSGFENNKLSMNSKLYSGYKKEKQCPLYFTCKDCKNNTVSYTCDYNETENELKWTAEGSCEPISCSVENLKIVCNATAGCELSSKLEEPNKSSITDSDDKSLMEKTENVVFEKSNSKYDEINKRYAIGSVIKLNEGRKYKYKGGKEVYAICESNGFWHIHGGFESLKCADSGLPTVNNASWTKANSSTCEDESESDGFSCPGIEKLLKCNYGYERAPNTEKLSTQCLYINDGRGVSWSNVNLNKEMASQYCIKESDI